MKMVERAVTQHNADRCPRCDSGLTQGLATENGIQRVQCQACGNLYTVILGVLPKDKPGEPVARMPDDPRMRPLTPYKKSRLGEELKDSPFSRTALEAAKKKEATTMAETCPKCGTMEFKVLGKHLRFCKGKRKAKDKGDGYVEENPDLPMKRGSKTTPKSAVGLIGSVVAMLQDKRVERIAALTAGDPELAEIDRVIAALGGG